MLKSPRKFLMPFAKRVSDLDWRFIGLIIPLVLFFVFFSLHSTTLNAFTSFYPVKQFLFSLPFQKGKTGDISENDPAWKDELVRSRMAVCLVGGARRFELTGPSIFEMILKQYPNSDLFLHSPLDSDSFKFSLLKFAPKVAAVRIFHPQPLPENESSVRVLTPHNSPNGIQGLLQYFNLVEGCLTMIKAHEEKNNFTYDWIIRTRVDGYWNAPLGPQNFVPGKYLVPPGSSYGGLNDRLGIGDITASTVALSRLSLIPQLDSAGFTNLNSEAAFKAQLTTQNVTYLTKRLPFCIVSDRKYDFLPGRFGVPVAALSSRGPLSGAKCRPCKPVCRGACVENVMESVEREWSWTDWSNGSLELCDAHESWENGWEKIFDRVAGKKLAAARKIIASLKMEQCIEDFIQLKKRTSHWSAPPVIQICRLGLNRSS
ncbi:uncharacterized protein LOC113865393 [Abrus precatorius]|uniref:Uncharacterized protein LOC113865393 n=1 Tax=Abrus precatorius TaxID=3816 RepID=A0A8B8LK08_ABRPR|nr:uncharacterized protein LOC113865393 [Abrus precatorius]